MHTRRAPINTPFKTTIVYPSALFSLEKDEVIPYERFAYNLLDSAIEALHTKNLNEQVSVNFTSLSGTLSPWTINASISFDLDATNRPTAFHFATPEMVPALLYVFCSVFAHDFCRGALSTEEDVRARLQAFVAHASAGVRSYRETGLATGIRAIYEDANLTFTDIQNHFNAYDLLTKQIALHEVGHAYIEQVSRRTPSSRAERRGFELLADLVATEWIYNKLVRNTPDSQEYRSYREHETYQQSIFENALLTQRYQQALLVMLALAGAQRNAGTATLSGGDSHPGGMQRHSLQHVHLYTLVFSNYKQILSEEQLGSFLHDWNHNMELLIASGLVAAQDVQESIDENAFENAEAAASLIEEMNVSELKKLVPMLRGFRALVQSRTTEALGL